MSWTLNAVAREHERANNTIPGVIYGGGQKAISISLDQYEAVKLLQSEKSWQVGYVILDSQEFMCTIKDVAQIAGRGPEHIDFLDIKKAKTFNAFIPIATTGTSVGVKRGGILSLKTSRLEVKLNYACLAALPEVINVDISQLQIKHAIHLDAIKLPSGIVPAHPARDGTIVTVTPPAGGMAKVATEAK